MSGSWSLGGATCPVCVSDEWLDVAMDDVGRFQYACSGPHHDKPYGWQVVEDDDGLTQRSGIGEEIGIYDDLSQLLSTDDPFLEYGIVEYRYARNHAQTYQWLVDRYSHVALGPTRYSASVFIGRALHRLADEGVLAFVPMKATGRWAYNGRLSGWSRAPGPADGTVVTWHDFAQAQGFGPDAWPPLETTT